MKIFLVNYSCESSEPEGSVIIAKDRQSALGYVEKGYDLVDEFSDDYDSCEFVIKEIDQSTAGVIYTGHYCC